MNRFLLVIAVLLGFWAEAGAQGTAPAANGAVADFAAIGRYKAANAALPAAGKKRVVFLGDSITQNWAAAPGLWFDNAEWVNRGIGGQTTQQLLLRERGDAIALQPKAIVLEGASNDMREGFAVEAIRDSIASMGELAQAHGIAVFVAGMTPVCDCVRPLTGLRTVEHIHALNALLVALCKEHGWTYMDWNTPLADENGLMRAELTVDGVHPNKAGYGLLAPVVLKALGKYR